MRKPEASSAGTSAPLPSRSLTDAQRLAWLRLIRSENFGPVPFRDLVNHFGGAAPSLAALPYLLPRGVKGRALLVAP